MKKGLSATLAALLCTATCMFGLVGCGHKHTFSEKWSSDDTYHWHEATCEHSDERSEYGEHTMESVTLEDYRATVTMCSVCGYSENDVTSQLVNEETFSSQIDTEITTNFRYTYKTVARETGAVLEEHVEQYDGNCYVSQTGVYHIGYNVYMKSPYIEGLYEEDRPATITAEQRVKSVFSSMLTKFEHIVSEELDFSYFHWSDQHYLGAETAYFVDLNKVKSNSVFRSSDWFALRFENGVLKEIESGSVSSNNYLHISTMEVGAAQIELPWDGDAPTIDVNGSSGLYYKMIEGDEYIVYNFYKDDVESGVDYVIVADTCNGKPVTAIRSGLFSNGGIYLGGIVIPTSITRFESEAFKFTTFRSIYYMGTEEQWNAISGLSLSGVESVYGLTVYYYSENAPTAEGNYWHYAEGVPTVWE